MYVLLVTEIYSRDQPQSGRPMSFIGNRLNAGICAIKKRHNKNTKNSKSQRNRNNVDGNNSSLYLSILKMSIKSPILESDFSLYFIF